jgi:argininosuccinate lyase
MSKLWQKSSTDITSGIAKKVEAFTVGNDYLLDRELVPFDLAASAVHAETLKDAGILTDDEFRQLAEGLEGIHGLWEQGQFQIRIEDEDMHTAIENFLTEKLGELGKKIHTARSRNDQVLTAVRLYEKQKLSGVLAEVKTAAGLLLDFAEKYEGVPMPGYTHTRKAMLSSVALWAGGFAELLIMQAEAAKGVASLVNRSPLGSAAGFGTTFPINRELEAEKLGFELPLICSTTAQLSRGWVELQVVQFLAGVTSALNRFAADVIQFSSEGYGFFDLEKVVCTGSSIMPQKKNPDLAELIRGRHALVVSHATALQSLLSNLTSGYHRDLQLTKEPVILAFNHTLETLEAVQILITAIKPVQKKLEEACTPELFAAEAAYDLVKTKGISFREAYQVIAENPDSAAVLTWQDVMDQFTHLGSPANPGTDRLRGRLNQV